MKMKDCHMTREQFRKYIDDYQKLSDKIQSDKSGISYIYPVHDADSFNVIASNHIRYLRDNWLNEKKQCNIYEIDWSKLANIDWTNQSILLHPILYPFAFPQTFRENSRNFSRLLKMKYKVGGFDVADSDKISQLAVDILNKLDLVIVPSNFARDSYINSGVKTPVEILPHGIPDEFLNDEPINTNNSDIMNLWNIKERGNIFVLYFLLHSHRRKGADLVAEVMRRIQSKYKNIIMVCKGPGVVERNFPGVNAIGLRSWMNIDDIRLLYDICDILICPSRGGGFELNALEAVSRGIPTLVPNGGCFLDYIDYFIPINLNNEKVQPLKGNPIHIGYGFEADINDFETQLIDAINNLEIYRSQFTQNSKNVRENCSWRNVAKTLEGYLKKYEFIN